jgi:hypothetical protein
MVRQAITINRPLESVRGKPLRWAVVTKEKGHLLAVFVFEAHARVYAMVGERKVEEIKQ